MKGEFKLPCCAPGLPQPHGIALASRYLSGWHDLAGSIHPSTPYVRQVNDEPANGVLVSRIARVLLPHRSERRPNRS
jgi:hypothetical protein